MENFVKMLSRIYLRLISLFIIRGLVLMLRINSLKAAPYLGVKGVKQGKESQ